MMRLLLIALFALPLVAQTHAFFWTAIPRNYEGAPVQPEVPAIAYLTVKPETPTEQTYMLYVHSKSSAGVVVQRLIQVALATVPATRVKNGWYTIEVPLTAEEVASFVGVTMFREILVRR